MVRKLTKIPRPARLHGHTDKIVTGCGNLYLTINKLDGKPFELIPNAGKAGDCVKCQLEAITRCITIGLRYGIPISEYHDQLRGLSCPKHIFNGGKDGTVLSCPDAISRILSDINKEIKGE